MRKFFLKRLPGRDGVLQNRWLQPIRHWLHHPNLWHLNRRSVAGGVALGLFCGLIPGPFQMVAAAFLAMWLRVNLPVALATTLYTNPFTIVPLYLLAHRIGLLVSGAHAQSPVAEFPELSWKDGFEQLWLWVMTLGEPLLVGLPVLAIGLAVIGYFAVRFAWRLAVQWKWYQRSKRYTERH
jgi:uncharacterized protein (DUF2062 family)